MLDAHNDVLLRLCDEGGDLAKPSRSAQVDIAKCRAGHLNAVWFGAWVNPVQYQGREAVSRTLSLIESLRQQVALHPNDLVLCDSALDVRQATASGKIAALLGIEGGIALADDPQMVDLYRRNHVRYITLTWRGNLSWAGSSQSEDPSQGLSPLGRQIIQEMNRVGMVIDLSHVSDQTFYDAIEISTKPVICSHSNTRALAPHPRNVSDDMLRRLRDNGGVIGVTFAHEFLEAAPTEKPRLFQKKHFGTLEDVLDEIDHIVQVAGIDHVGLGSDWEGGMLSARGLESAAKMQALFDGLRKRNYSEEAINKIAGGNFLRVLEANDSLEKPEKKSTSWLSRASNPPASRAKSGGE